MTNKLLFTLIEDYGEDIILISNNHKDLEDYLKTNYDWYYIHIYDDYVSIRVREGYEKETASLKWIKQI